MLLDIVFLPVSDLIDKFKQATIENKFLRSFQVCEINVLIKNLEDRQGQSEINFAEC